jgi:hypothetical protein
VLAEAMLRITAYAPEVDVSHRITITPTLLDAGVKSNPIPDRARQ